MTDLKKILTNNKHKFEKIINKQTTYHNKTLKKIYNSINEITGKNNIKKSEFSWEKTQKNKEKSYQKTLKKL